uniref:Uncharacterized protein n=1 Tax=Aotus nancymaae TaxID=37293 RepID=A0A2K5E3S5_AOTNA
MDSKIEAQSAGAEEGFTQVTRKGGRRAKKRQAEQLSAAGEGGDVGLVDTEEARSVFPPLCGDGLLSGKEETRKIPVPANRYTPSKENWMKIFTPIVEHLGLQIRFNLQSRNVEIGTCKETRDGSGGLRKLTIMAGGEGEAGASYVAGAGARAGGRRHAIFKQPHLRTHCGNDSTERGWC